VPPVFPTPRRPGAEDLERHRFLTEAIESLIRRSEQNSAAKELFFRFDADRSGSISAHDFCSIVQQSGVGLEVTAPVLWAAAVRCLPRGAGAHTRSFEEGRVQLGEFIKFNGYAGAMGLPSVVADVPHHGMQALVEKSSHAK
jgi:hypothetical protein